MTEHGSPVLKHEDDRFLSCTNCGYAFPIDSMLDDEDCYMCGGVLAIRVMPEGAQ